MAEHTVTCWNCGAESNDPEWCDVCGAELQTQQDDEPWLDVFDAFAFPHEGRTRLARVTELTECYATRRVGLARVCPPEHIHSSFTAEELLTLLPEDAQPKDTPDLSSQDISKIDTSTWDLVLFEESNEDLGALQPHVLPESIHHLVYIPISSTHRSPQRLLDVFEATGGAPLHDYLESLGRPLSIEEAAGVTFLLMDAVEQIHDVDLYHFQVCPWTIRIITAPQTEPEDEEIQDQHAHNEGSSPSKDSAETLELSASQDEETNTDDNDAKDAKDDATDSDANPSDDAEESASAQDDTNKETNNDDNDDNDGNLPPEEPLKLIFEGIRGFYHSAEPVESHPVIMGFSPPEFFGRSQGPLDARADIFAIGMVFYYLLAGALPPSGNLTRNAPCLPVRAYRFDIPPGLQTFIDGCTAVESDTRYANIEEARRGLSAALDIVHRRSLQHSSPSRNAISLYCSVDRHIGIGKGRRSPINQDSVFLGHDPAQALSLITIGDGVSTASFGSGDVASKLLVTAAMQAWAQRTELARTFHNSLDSEITLPNTDLNNDDDTPPAETTDDTPPPRPNHDHLKGRVGLTGSRSAPPVLHTPYANFLQDILNNANQHISAHINDRFHPFHGLVHEVMGTTSIMALVTGDVVTLSSLGDSRIYLLRDGHMECLTRDHNLATLRMIEGFPADESLLITHGKALARCLGTFHVDDEGTLQPISPEPDYVTFRLLPGDTLLLTTDGLVDFAGPTEAAAEANIQAILEHEEVPSLACVRLMLLANEGGGEDNIGLSVLRVTEPHPSINQPPLVQSFPPTFDALES